MGGLKTAPGSYISCPVNELPVSQNQRSIWEVLSNRFIELKKKSVGMALVCACSASDRSVQFCLERVSGIVCALFVVHDTCIIVPCLEGTGEGRQ